MIAHRVKFDFIVHFTNGGCLSGQDFRLDIPGNDIVDNELAAYLIQDLRLLMVGHVDITNKQIIEEPHKRDVISAGSRRMPKPLDSGFGVDWGPMQIERIDHLVLTVRDIDASCDFYSRVLGMEVVTFGDNRKALAFGAHKINLHQYGHEFEPKAAHPTPGSADICLISSTPISAVITHLAAVGVPMIEGPVRRTGATGAILSVYFRDVDSNLIEISNYVDA